MNALALTRIIRSGASSLAESLEDYWPTWGLNEIAEANQVLHIGRAFLEQGYLGFAEAHQDGGATRRFDLLVIEPTNQTLLVCEFKRIYNAAQVELVCGDAKRLMGFAPMQPQRSASGLVIKEQWGLVGGTTWLEEYAAWFLDREISAIDPTGGNLDALWKTLKPMRPTWGAYPLVTYFDPETKKIVPQWFVFALFKKP
jgi:hypothetical protein